MQDSILRIVKHWSEICRTVEGTKSYWKGDSADAHNRIYEDVKRDLDEVFFGSGEGMGINTTDRKDDTNVLPEVF